MNSLGIFGKQRLFQIGQIIEILLYIVQNQRMSFILIIQTIQIVEEVHLKKIRKSKLIFYIFF